MNMTELSPRSQITGVLYAEDFSASVIEDGPSLEKEPVVVEVKASGVTEKELDDAKRRAYADGLRAAQEQHEREKQSWDHTTARRIQELLEQIAISSDARAQKSAEAIVVAVFKSVVPLFNQTAKKYGIQERDSLLIKIKPALKNIDRVRVYAHSSEIKELSNYCQENGVADIDTIVDDGMESGDFRISWDEGSVFRDSVAVARQIMQSIFTCSEIENTHPKAGEMS